MSGSGAANCQFYLIISLRGPPAGLLPHNADAESDYVDGSWLASPSLLDGQSQRKKTAVQADINPRKSFLMRHRYLPGETEDCRRPQQAAAAAAAPPVSLIAVSLCQELLMLDPVRTIWTKASTLCLYPVSMWRGRKVSGHRASEAGLLVRCAVHVAKCQTPHRYPPWPRPRHLPL